MSLHFLLNALGYGWIRKEGAIETAWNLNPVTPQQGEGQGGGDGLETKYYRGRIKIYFKVVYCVGTVPL